MRLLKTLSFYAILGVSFVITLPAYAGKAHVSVAANFTATAQDLAQAFTKTTGHEITLSFGSTGKLFTQIIHGAPFDVFLAADVERPVLLEKEGWVVLGSRFTYAQGQIVLWSRDPSRINPNGNLVEQSALMRDQTTTRLAIANPKTAPYGRAAIETLNRAGVYEDLKSKIVQGENIAQTYQFAYTGNAELAIVSLSQAGLSEMGSHWVIPTELYSSLDQQVVLLKRAADNKAALAFMAFLQSDEAAGIIRKFGYTTIQD
ncbi:molybdate ABC transporter substrate-binding protein [Kiloniella antarctica]|uniref:Molybdate ABC transporter substrate-binding protein n=1 Tax=Kiloniella antarctica TaxID=1550907 RepID=A0ABW5BJI0_9PROT